MATKLYVGNLPRSATDSTLNGFVTDAGFQVASATVVIDKMSGQSRGFGFVELAAGEDMQRAIGSLNGRDFDGRPLTVNEARPQRTGFGGGGGHQRSGGGRDRFERKRNY
jgi:RNA recognition motif-containing protein